MKVKRSIREIEGGLKLETKNISWREEIIKLFPDTTERIKNDNEEWCPKCNGLGLIRENKYIVGCTTCCGKGVIKLCECGQKIDKPYTICKSCRDKKEQEKEKERFEKAEKINYENYDGNFLWNDRVLDKEALEDELYTIIYGKKEPPIYVYATKEEKVFNFIDLVDIVADKCEDGYEDMDENFDYKDSDFLKAQELVDKWLNKHEENLYCYYEDYNKVITLDEIIQKLKKEISKE